MIKYIQTARDENKYLVENLENKLNIMLDNTDVCNYQILLIKSFNYKKKRFGN